jgi:hypothetical protein
MAIFKPMELMSEVHGKFSGKSEYYAAEKYGTQYTGKIGEIKVPPTEVQIAHRNKFAQARANVLGLSTEEMNAYSTAFKARPGKYKSLAGYIFAQEMAKLNDGE